MKELIGVKELAQYLKVNPQTIYNWVADNKIPYTKVGDLLRFSKLDIDEWVKKKTAYPDRIRYKEFEIEATTYQLKEPKGWSLSILVWKHSGSKSVSRAFIGSNIYVSKEEAIEHCFNFGKKIIDGDAENCSVDNL